MTNDERNPKPECPNALSCAVAGFVLRISSFLIRVSELRFMGSPDAFFSAHWDDEPASSGGTARRFSAAFPGMHRMGKRQRTGAVQDLARIFHTPLECAPPRRVRAGGLQRLPRNPCRPGPLTRRSACEICGLAAWLPFMGSPSRFMRRCCPVLALSAVVVANAQPVPKITSVSPDWVQRGTTSVVVLEGENLSQLNGFIFSGDGGLTATN